MEVSALKYSGGIGLHGRSPLLRLQSDERLIGFVRKGNQGAFEVLVSRYESRLLSFCRHLLGSREDAEDVLQEVFAAAFNAILADDRPINVRPWLYRIARNRSLNHLRRIQAVGLDSMDIHFSDYGASTADKVHEREEFLLLVGDINCLPETQKTALVLREMDALSYEQIAEAMETTVPSVKSLLVRARVSLAEAAEARLLSCDEVRIELGEIAEGLRRRPSPLVRRHLKACKRCDTFRVQLKDTNKALAALLPIGPLVLLRKFVLGHLGQGSGATAAGSTASAAGSTAAVGSTAAIGSTVGSTAGGVISAGIGAIATKAAAGLAVTALVTAGAVEVTHVTGHSRHAVAPPAVASMPESPAPDQFFTTQGPAPATAVKHTHKSPTVTHMKHAVHATVASAATAPATTTPTTTKKAQPAAAAPKPVVKQDPKTNVKTASTPPPPPPPPAPGRTQAQTVPTVLSASAVPPASATATSITAATTVPIAAPVEPAPTSATAAGSDQPTSTSTGADTTATDTTTATSTDTSTASSEVTSTGNGSGPSTGEGSSTSTTGGGAAGTTGGSTGGSSGNPQAASDSGSGPGSTSSGTQNGPQTGPNAGPGQTP